MTTHKQVAQWLDQNEKLFTDMADEIWAKPELQFQEFFASKLQADFLEEAGFKITWDIAGMNTAFIAEWGSGGPIIGFAGEYDALPGLSQKLQPTPEALETAAPGHACGHNLLGTGCLAAAVATKHWLERNGQTGTVRYYGCPAEEGGSGKTFMARDGFYDDLDAAFNFHPGYANYASKGSVLGVNHVKYRFHGRAAHAAAMPHMGRSALDAVELMNIGVNYLREHIQDNARIHYVITNGGQAPNIVPDTAEVYYYIRAHLPQEVEELTQRVRKVAQGAAMMTETRLEEIYVSGSSSVLSNYHLADLQHEVMQALGPIEFSESEMTYAQTINDHNSPNNQQFVTHMFSQTGYKVTTPLIGDVFPSMDEGDVFPASTDVGDLSWKAPVSMLNTTCWPTGAAAHSWGVVASGGMGIGHKGMMYAAKVMAAAAVALFQDPAKVTAVREEFEAQTAAIPYICPIPEGVRPPQYKNPLR